MAPIDYIIQAGICTAITLSVASSAYCLYEGYSFGSVTKIIRFVMLISYGLGGAVCGGVICALAGFILGAIGGSGKASLNERTTLTLQFAMICGFIGVVIGGCMGVGSVLSSILVYISDMKL